jgi:hypothetical protein
MFLLPLSLLFTLISTTLSIAIDSSNVLIEDLSDENIFSLPAMSPKLSGVIHPLRGAESFSPPLSSLPEDYIQYNLGAPVLTGPVNV